MPPRVARCSDTGSTIRSWRILRGHTNLDFFDTLTHFLHRYAFEPADSGDFIRSVKTVTGQNLDWFFDQWLFKPGHPVFEIHGDLDPSRKVIVLTVAQV